MIALRFEYTRIQTNIILSTLSKKKDLRTRTNLSTNLFRKEWRGKNRPRINEYPTHFPISTPVYEFAIKSICGTI
jgi:hypothetical protein